MKDHNFLQTNPNQTGLRLFYNNPDKRLAELGYRVEQALFTINDLYAQETTKVITLDDICIAKISYRESILTITSDYAIDFKLSGYVAAKTVIIKTEGNVLIHNAELNNLSNGLSIIASSIDLDVPEIKTHSIFLETQESNTGEIVINSVLTANVFSAKGHKLVVNAKVSVSEQATIDVGQMFIDKYADVQLNIPTPEQRLSKEQQNKDVQDTTKDDIISKPKEWFHKSSIKCKRLKCLGRIAVNKAVIDADLLCLMAGSRADFENSLISANNFRINRDSHISGADVIFDLKNDMDVEGKCIIDKLIVQAQNLTVNNLLWGLSNLELRIKDNISNSGVIGSSKTSIKASFLVSSALHLNQVVNHWIFCNGAIAGREELKIDALTTSVFAGACLYGKSVEISNAGYINVMGMVVSYQFFSRSLCSLSTISAKIPFCLEPIKMPRTFTNVIDATGRSIKALAALLYNIVPFANLIPMIVDFVAFAASGINNLYHMPKTWERSKLLLSGAKSAIGTTITEIFHSLWMISNIFRLDRHEIKQLVDKILKANDIAVYAYSGINLMLNAKTTIESFSDPKRPIITGDLGTLGQNALSAVMPSVTERSLLNANFDLELTGASSKMSLVSVSGGAAAAIVSSNTSVYMKNLPKVTAAVHHSETAVHRDNSGTIHALYANIHADQNHERGKVHSDVLHVTSSNLELSKDAEIKSNDAHISVKNNLDSHGSLDIGSGSIAVDGKLQLHSDSSTKAKNTTILSRDDATRAGYEDLEDCSFTVLGDNTTTESMSGVYKNVTEFVAGSSHDEGEVNINGGSKFTAGEQTYGPKMRLTAQDYNVQSSSGINVDSGASLGLSNVVFTAPKFSHNGKIHYSETLHIDTGHIESSADSTIEKDSQSHSTFGLDCDTSDRKGFEHHHSAFETIRNASATQARDEALTDRKLIDSFISVTCNDPNTYEYAGIRKDGAHVSVLTAGKVSLPNYYDRASGKTFDSYEDAHAFIINEYPHFNLPVHHKHKPLYKKWGDKFVKNVAKPVANGFAEYGQELAVIISCIPAAGPVVGAAVQAAAVGTGMALDGHEKRKIDRLSEAFINEQRLGSDIARKNLPFAQKSAALELERAQHYMKVFDIQNRNLNPNYDKQDQPMLQELFADSKNTLAADFEQYEREIAEQLQQNTQQIRSNRQRAIDAINARNRKIGVGVSLTAGTTGYHFDFTTTSSVNGKPFTTKQNFHNHDYARYTPPPEQMPTRSYYEESLPEFDTEVPIFGPEIYGHLPNIFEPDFREVPVMSENPERDFNKGILFQQERFANSSNEDSNRNHSAQQARDTTNLDVTQEKSKIRKFFELFEQDDDFHTDFHDVRITPELREGRSFAAKSIARNTIANVKAALDVTTYADGIVLAWDGMNELSNEAFGIASQDSLMRGQDRARNLYQAWNTFKELDGTTKSFVLLDMTIGIATGVVVGAAMGSASKVVFTFAEKNAINPMLRAINSDIEKYRRIIKAYRNPYNYTWDTPPALPLQTAISEALQRRNTLPVIRRPAAARSAPTGSSQGQLLRRPVMFSDRGQTKNFAKLSLSELADLSAARNFTPALSKQPTACPFTVPLNLTNPSFREKYGFTSLLRRPHSSWGDKDILREFDYLNPVKSTQRELDIITQWGFERKKMLQLWDSEDLSGVNNKLRDFFDTAYNQLRDHMYPGDICGIMKEKRGIKIFAPNGKRLDHIGEWDDAKNTFKDTFNSFNKCDWSEKEYATASKRISEISKLWERYDRLISRGIKKCQVKPTI